jgi:ABC transport system ATP-binding/permease protein
MAAPTFFRQDGTAIAAAQQRLAALNSEIEQAYARWEALDSP